ncbi:MAG: hypothetical protein ACE5QF_01615 [Thermoplasmata archaeon]
MNRYALVIGVAFVLVTVFSATTLALTVDTYQAFTDARIKLTPSAGNIYIKEVRIPLINSLDTDVRVTILVEVNNPTRLDVWVYNIEFQLWMLNESTMGNIGNPQAMEQSYVWTGGFFRYDDPDYFVPSGGNATLLSSLTVTSRPKLEALNKTDAQGRYYPFIRADMRYNVVDLDIAVPVHGIYFFSTTGVEPYEG